MIDLWLSIGCSTLIYIVFKLLGILRADTLNAIVYNYIVATALGAYLYGNSISLDTILSAPWLPHAIVVGCLFVGMFFLIAYSTQKIGISITSLSAKISMIIPILFSILIWGEDYGVLKIVGIALAVLSIVLATLRKEDSKSTWLILLPLFIFIGSGCVDTIVTFTQKNFLDESTEAIFSATLFATSAIAGILVLMIKKPTISSLVAPSSILGGIALGVVNFGSLYFIIRALGNPDLETSIIFGLNNMCIVALSSIVGATIFREALTKLNWAGVLLAFISIFILSFV